MESTEFYCEGSVDRMYLGQRVTIDDDITAAKQNPLFLFKLLDCKLY